MKYEEIISDIQNDLKIDKNDLTEESIRTPVIHNKYAIALSKTRILFSSLKNSLSSKEKEKWLYYTGKADSSVYKEKPFNFKLLRGDVKMMVDSDDEVLEIKHKIGIIEAKLELLESTLREIGRRTFTINNIVKYQSMMAGNDI